MSWLKKMFGSREVAARTEAGALPVDGSQPLADVELPPGRPFQANDATIDGVWTPFLWVTDEHVDIERVWDEVAAACAEGGFSPLVIDTEDTDGDEPWGALDPGMATAPDAHDAGRVLEAWWRDVVPEETGEHMRPFGRAFPGLAAASEDSDVDARADVARSLSGRLALVTVLRPADVVAKLGWEGASPHIGDMGRLSAVLRSWEDRFGAYVVGLGLSKLTLAVSRPPETLEAARAIAAEHLAACPDTIHQAHGTVEEHAERLIGRDRWSLWWD